MQIAEQYSHRDGKKHLIEFKQGLWEEVEEVISNVKARPCKIESKEKGKEGKPIYSARKMNRSFKKHFKTKRGWKAKPRKCWATSDAELLKEICKLPKEKQREKIEEEIEKSSGVLLESFDQPDFEKDRVAVEVQFNDWGVSNDIFVKFPSLYSSDEIDVGIEIVPMKELQQEMSSGVNYYERVLLNIIRSDQQVKGVPAAPLVLIGIAA